MSNGLKKYWIGLILIFVVGILLPWLWFFKQKPVTPNTKMDNVSVAPKENLDSVAVNGLLVDKQVAQNRPVAVMVENYPDARPQSGLVDADMVYETVTEGGITRFMAVYQTQASKSIGPVRSARIYFADFANELGAVYAHVGGNSDALANIKAGEYPNLSDADQFFNDPYFERVTFRPMPHNVYTSVDKLEKLITHHKYNNTAQYQAWKFKDDSAVATSTASNIQIDFSLKEYAVAWHYNAKENLYARFLANQPHKDLGTGKQIQAKNIIVQVVTTAPTKTDTVLSISMDLNAGGKAYMFLDGQATVGTWKRQNGRTRYYDASNNEISFNRGQTWVELLPDDKTVTWK